VYNIQLISRNVLSSHHHKIKGTGEDIHPTTLQKVQEEVEGRPEQMVISTMMSYGSIDEPLSQDNV
jgi:exoribonuclease R